MIATENNINGDRYILARFNLRYGVIVEDSNNNLNELLKEIPNHLHEDNDENLSVCEVKKWKQDKVDKSDLSPVDLETLFTVIHYSDPLEEE